MNRIKSLGRYQKGILLFMAVMVVVFWGLYSSTISRVGFAYQDTILVPSQEGDNRVYTGKIQGEPAVFTVYPDSRVEFQWGEKACGPYTVTEDPSAIPKELEADTKIKGVELRLGEEILFRGGIRDNYDRRWLYNQDGSLAYVGLTPASGGMVVGTPVDTDDPGSPSPAVLLNLVEGPPLTHKGDWGQWLTGAIICVITAVSILFVDELFRWNLSFQIRHANRAEPSDWEIASRYISWTLLPLMALAIFIIGLQ